MARASLIRDYFEAIVVAVMLSLFVRTFLFEAFKIPTPSMEESLMVGDHIIVDKFSLGPRLGFEIGTGFLPMRPIRRGDVVVFKFEREPEKDYVKRVVGLPGDEVRVDNKRLFINGKPAEEAYVRHVDAEVIPERDFLPNVKVPAGHYFLMGDNRDNSADSREWGFVPRDRIRGRALLVYWSVDSSGTPGAASANLFTQTRWDRTFRAIR